MPSILKQHPRIALALLAGAAGLLAVLASVTLTGGDDGDGDTGAVDATPADPGIEEPTDAGDGSAGAQLGGGATSTTTPVAPDDTTGVEGGADGQPSAGGTSGREPISGSIVVSGPPVQEGPAEEGEPDPTPISEAAALACANVEFAVDAWDDDDPGAFQSHLAEAVALAGEAPEPALTDAVPALQDAAAAVDPVPGITRFLEACAASGYAI